MSKGSEGQKQQMDFKKYPLILPAMSERGEIIFEIFFTQIMLLLFFVFALVKKCLFNHIIKIHKDTNN